MKTFLDRVLGSIATKIAVILCAMAAVTMVGIFTSTTVFNQTSRDLDRLNRSELPEIQFSAQILTQANALESAVLAMLLAETVAQMDQGAQDAQAAIDQLGAISGQSSNAAMARVLDRTAAIEAATLAMAQARAAEFAAQDALNLRLTQMRGLSKGVIETLEKEIEIRKANLKIAGGRTVRDVGGSLENLMNHDMHLLHLTHAAQAESHLLFGTAVAMTQASDPAVLTNLRATLAAHLPELQTLAQQITAMEHAALQGQTLDAALGLFARLDRKSVV